MAEEKNEFGAWDYVVFAALLIISMGIGVFFALRGGKQKTQSEYLLANRSMSILPVAISILVSFMSAILILGTPAEMYTQGTEYFLATFGISLGITLAALLFVPLLYPLKITSAFEYIEKRFNSRAARLVGTGLFILRQILYMGLASYAPSTALEAVTGFPVWATILSIGAVATFYTTLGGMKAVVWTDVFQSVVMMGGLLVIVIQGSIDVGGISRVWELNEEYKRIKFFTWDADPTTRHSVWSLVVGQAMMWIGTYGVNQASVQRFSSLPTMGKATLSVLLNIIGVIILLTVTCLSGVVLFAYYAHKGCDPLGLKIVSNSNQGGMKAVVWTDVFQSVVMMGGLLVIVIQGSIDVGGISRVWELNEEYKRIKFFTWDADPTTRHSVWSLVVGQAMMWVGTYGVNQASVQRFSSLPTMGKATLSVLLNIIGVIILLTVTCLSGVVLFAYYAHKGCDPLGLKIVSNSNQLIPLFVMETLNYPGVPGLFISSLFSGALSSVSSSLNALAAITWEDVLKNKLNDKLSESRKTVLTKFIVVVYGCCAIGVSFVAQQLEGTVLQAATSLIGGVAGPMTGLFALGAFFPWANKWGAIVGPIVGLAMSLWLSIGAYVTGIPRLQFPYPNGTCYASSNVSMTTTSVSMATMTTVGSVVLEDDGRSGMEVFYSISYLWFPAIGIATTIIVGLIVSFITGPNSIDDVPTRYQIPLFSRLFCCLPQSWLYKLNCCRQFEKPEDIRAEEKDTEMIITSPSQAALANKEKNGFANTGFNSIQESQGTPQQPQLTFQNGRMDQRNVILAGNYKKLDL